MKFRELTTSDYSRYYPLINDFRPTSFTEEQFTETFNSLSPHIKIYVLEDNNELLATATVIYETKFIFNICKLAHIEDVCVKKEYRAKGLGKLIVQHCIDVAKDNNAYKLTLDCAETNIRFYEKCGLEVRGTQMTKLFFDPAKNNSNT
jgi:glucosamine-phosphate N-acetyltransferase